MVTQYDEKGKIFTQVVAKQPIRVMIRTGQQTITGLIHVRPGMRIKDELNNPERFLAVTDAVLKENDSGEEQNCGFLVVNVDHIIWIMPQEDLPH